MKESGAPVVRKINTDTLYFPFNGIGILFTPVHAYTFFFPFENWHACASQASSVFPLWLRTQGPSKARFRFCGARSRENFKGLLYEKHCNTKPFSSAIQVHFKLFFVTLSCTDVA